MNQIIIFDFDGTLADTLDAVVRITNRLSGEFGYLPTNPETLGQIQNLSSWQIIQQSGISVFKLPFFLKRVLSELHQDVELIHLFPTIPEILRQLQEQNYTLYIITSNSKINVSTILSRYDLVNTFKNIYSGISLFGKYKIINQLLAQEKIEPQQAIYIGDETRDINAAKQSKIKSIAVSWGYNSAEILAQHHPDALIAHPSELIAAIKNVSMLTVNC
ncbi:Phosphoglycolate phosphatase [Planktothrix serta PCC 8927]|uniref:Phosphoglycolate phosphatase n=1 Tax=Planktothrix serta PCC 8927 TaxID=671068 RepID=A0A7Z9BMT8_9CYAN|nr:HAD hydrolase-like protein [Planktothrix serta]VXD17826.1 Phosphoglycolate phosphatase [Planktothrix serta PCC 8927]